MNYMFIVSVPNRNLQVICISFCINLNGYPIIPLTCSYVSVINRNKKGIETDEKRKIKSRKMNFLY